MGFKTLFRNRTWIATSVKPRRGSFHSMQIRFLRCILRSFTSLLRPKNRLLDSNLLSDFTSVAFCHRPVHLRVHPLRLVRKTLSSLIQRENTKGLVLHVGKASNFDTEGRGFSSSSVRLDTEHRLAEINGLLITNQDLDNRAATFRRYLVENFHRLNDANDGIRRNPVTHLDECR